MCDSERTSGGELNIYRCVTSYHLLRIAEIEHEHFRGDEMGKASVGKQITHEHRE